jgi:hypothetical protein
MGKQFKNRSIAARVKEAERLSRQRDAARLRDALARFVALDVATKLEIARQLVETRSRELQLAYSDIRHLGIGFRLRRRRLEKKDEREVCVTLLVKQKWKKGTKTASPARRRRVLPRHLFAYHSVAEQAMLCAIPTDVLAQKGIRSRSTIIAVGGGSSVTGEICCVVRTPFDDGTVYALGCHHVAALSRNLNPPADFSEVHLQPRGQGSLIGNLSPYRGLMMSHPPIFSFDAALVSIPNTATAMANLQLASKNVPDFGAALSIMPHETEYRIRTDRGDVTAHFTNYFATFGGDQVSYAVPDVVQQEIYLLQADDRIIGGDSGCPVYEADGTTFAGMVIASDIDTETLVAVIPAFRLLRAANYGIVAGNDGAALRLTAPPNFPI